MDNSFENEYYKQLKNKILINSPFIYIYSVEHDRVKESINILLQETNIVDVESSYFIWSINKGFRNYKTNNSKYKETPLYELIDIINSLREKTVFVLRDIDRLFKEEPRTISILLDCIEQIRLGQPAILIASCKNIYIPTELEVLTEFLKLPLLDTAQITKLAENIFTQYKFFLDKVTLKLLSSALLGLAHNEIESMIYEILIKSSNEKRSIGFHDIDSIILKKKDIVSKSGVLELVVDKVPLEDVGGLSTLKKWLIDRKKIFNDVSRARENGLIPPKGVLLFGVPGAGKSLTSKMIASCYNIPLLRFDLGMIFGQESPENSMLKALALSESLAPCVLWIDEVEKAFSGSGIGAGSNANAEINRIFGQLLTWMQEKKKDVFIAITSNNISQLEPTLYRDGRISERFFLGFIKNHDDLKSILDVHLKIRLKDKVDAIVKPLDYILIMNKMNQMVAKYRGEEYAGYSGANIEALVEKVLEKRFFDNQDQIETRDFIYMLNWVRPQHGLLIKEMLDKAYEIEAIEA